MSDRRPLRFVAMTYNLWATQKWPEREPALRKLLRTFQPDILCVQELRPETRACLDEELPEHGRVDDVFEGWIRQGNIYWSNALFDLVTYGAEDVGILESFRRLFWVRLKFKGAGQTLFVSTAHFTYQGNQREREVGISPRLEQARRTAEALNRLAFANEPVLFMGDLNDSVNPIRLLRRSGLQDSFTALGIPCIPTHPVLPSSDWRTPQVLDWQFHRGPLRVFHTTVVDFFAGGVAPSDHKPVITTYGIDV